LYVVAPPRRLRRMSVTDLELVHRPAHALKRLVTLFWACYFSLIALTNLIGLLDALWVVHWTFLNSGNYEHLRDVVGVYRIGHAVTVAFLAGAVAIESGAAAAFWRATRDGRIRSALLALWAGAAVWIAFIFMTEFFIAHESQPAFRELLMLTLASALVIALMPDELGGDSGRRAR
jgi:hypothetical protein